MFALGAVASAATTGGTPAIITSSGTDTGSPPAAWLDGVNTGSTVGAFDYPAGAFASGVYGKDFGAGGKVVTKLKLYGSTSSGTGTNTGSGNLYVQYSNDGSSWTAAGNSTTAGVASANWVGEVTTGVTSAHRYWRWALNSSAGDGTMYLAESEWTGY